jgi:hypothetical protein
MTSRPLRIAFIGGRGVAGTYSGIETYYEEIGSRLTQRGHAVTAYCRRYFTPAIDSYRGIRVRRLPSVRSKHCDTLTHSLLSTLDCLRRDYDLVQFHAIGSAPLALLPRLRGQTTLVSVRGLDWQRAKWGARRARCCAPASGSRRAVRRRPSSCRARCNGTMPRRTAACRIAFPTP